jgi:predicted O-methyltransferase YrrM
LLDDICEKGQVETSDGRILKLHSALSHEEGMFIQNLIGTNQTIARTLEIGCAYGMSSLHICSALRGRQGARHTIVDPFQTTDWESVGVTNLKREGFDFFDLIEEGSEFALPRLARAHAGEFDLVLVDGMHTFDHTMLDCFYATRLLRVGGFLVVDDTNFASVSRVLSFVANYPCYEHYGRVFEWKLGWKAKTARALLRMLRIPFSKLPYAERRQRRSDKWSMIALRKRAPDLRSSDWHVDF